MAEIHLPQGYVALVDDADYEWLSQYKWHAKRHHGTVYAQTHIKTDGKWKATRMHRLLVDAPQVDHIDGDGLNNRRSNLRPCSSTQNCRNRKPRKNTKAGLKGVSWHKRSGKWYAAIRVDKRLLWLGQYDDKVEAARAYDKAARKYFGTFAKINFPAAEAV